ncbi:hypothetical protein E2C01_101810 [Portunus trituberculatus]|uniref:Uncharacterized protein n=1 Tax=Portunus trituberculatus TaxID=210409 RepID=A0A5B7KAR6_PORTR|nr:hypothetical protein [Portunus trituberculatus]
MVHPSPTRGRGGGTGIAAAAAAAAAAGVTAAVAVAPVHPTSSRQQYHEKHQNERAQTRHTKNNNTFITNTRQRKKTQTTTTTITIQYSSGEKISCDTLLAGRVSVGTIKGREETRGGPRGVPMGVFMAPLTSTGDFHRVVTSIESRRARRADAATNNGDPFFQLLYFMVLCEREGTVIGGMGGRRDILRGEVLVRYMEWRRVYKGRKNGEGWNSGRGQGWVCVGDE